MIDHTIDPPQAGHLQLSQLFQVASRLQANGYALLPVLPGTKRVNVKKWQRSCLAPPSRAATLRYVDKYPNHGVAIACGRCCAVDIDIDDEDQASRADQLVRDIVPGEPLVRYGKYPRRILLYRSENPLHTRHQPSIDVLGVGSYFVAYGSHPDTGKPYRWDGESPITRRLSDLPIITDAHVESICNEVTKLVGPPAISTGGAGHVCNAEQGLVADGRDTEMRNIVWSVWAAGENDRDSLIEAAWSLFSHEVDLSRPKRNGSELWSKADVAKKVGYLLKSGKARPTPGRVFELRRDLDERPLQAFAGAINSLGASGHLAPADVRVSHCMLELCRTRGVCFLSVEEIARRLDLAIGTVKRSRGKLVTLGLWFRSVQGGGRGNLSFLTPLPEQACALAEKVTKMEIRSSSEEEEMTPEEFIQSQKENENEKYIQVFKSLILSPGETDHA